ncbi:MAG: EAL domain-containing protein, partial [Pseudomonadales bacterium]
ALKSAQDLTITQSYYLDTSTQLPLAQVQQQAFIETSASGHSGQKIPWSFDPVSYWIKLELNNLSSGEQPLIVHFDNPMLDQLDIYDSHYPEREATALGWASDKPSMLDRSINNYPLTLNGLEQRTLYVRIETAGIAKTPIKIYRPGDFTQLVRSVHLIWGAFIGILIMMSLYNLLLFYGLRERVFLIYIGYIISTLAMMSVVQGFAHYLVPQWLYAFMRVHVINLNYSTLIFAVLFALFFLGYHRTREPLYLYAQSYVIGLLILSGVSFFLPESSAAPLFFIALALAYPLCFWLLYKRFHSDQFWSTLYLISWVPLLTGAAIQPLELTDVIPYSFAARNAYAVGILLEVILMAMALSERVRRQKVISLYNANHDLETGLPNTHALQHQLQYHIEREQHFTLCLFEINHFTKLSPYMSPQQSDTLVQQLVSCASEYTDADNRYIRIGPEKIKLARLSEQVFALMLRESSDRLAITDQLAPLAQQLDSAISRQLPSMSLRCRFGFYRVTSAQLAASTVLKKAYQALESARLSKRQISAHEARKHFSLNLADDLRQALQDDSLQLYHQVQITLADGSVHGSEGLLRWQHPSHGSMPVEAIIALAEDTGLINPLTLWVIERACRDLQTLTAMGFPTHRVSVNISANDITDSDFLKNVSDVVAPFADVASRLSLELTESVMIDDYSDLNRVLQGLSALGISVSIDDYGTGYSSLSRILQLPFSELKIDRLFIMDLERSSKNRNIVTTTLEMAKLLNLKVVAEGVENQAIAQLLRGYGCDVAQGFHYAKPLDFEHYTQYLQRERLSAQAATASHSL